MTQNDYCLVRDVGRLAKGAVVGTYNGLNAISPKLGKHIALATLAFTAFYGACSIKNSDNPSESNTRYHFAPVQERSIDTTIDTSVQESRFPWLPVGAGVAGGALLGAGAVALRNRRRRNINLEDLPTTELAVRSPAYNPN